MLNPGLDIDYWIDIAYIGNKNSKSNNVNPYKDNLPLDSEIQDYLAKAFKKTPETSNKVKIKKIGKEKFLALESHLKVNVIGQDEAIGSVVSALKRSQVGLNDPNRPLGVFLFAGASGVGKTHLANCLHRYLFGSENSMVRIDCGEFQHKHENQKLIGSPPGYIGHEDGGQLVNLIKKYPNTVVLLDEVEKAHPDLWNTFLRIFDDGIVTDNKGKEISFRNTVIIMTTNLGNDKIADTLLKSGTGFTNRVDFKTKTKELPPKEIVEKNTLEEIRKHFKPEFLNRLDKTIVFNYLTKDDYIKIAELEMSVIMAKLTSKGYSSIYSDAVLEALIEKGIDSVKGARGLAQIRREKIEDPLADIILNHPVPRGSIFEIDYTDDFVIRLRKPKKATVKK